MNRVIDTDSAGFGEARMYLIYPDGVCTITAGVAATAVNKNDLWYILAGTIVDV